MSKELYTQGEYFKQHPSWFAEDSSWKSKQIIEIISRNNLKPKSICEVGCGAGEIINQLHRQMSSDISFVGYEISPQAFQLCQQKQKERLTYYLKDLTQDSGVFFDILLVIDVLEHVEDCIGFLRHLKRKARYKIFHIPLDISLQTVFRVKPLVEHRKKGHIHLFTKETALAALDDAGYDVIDAFYTTGGIDLPKSFMQLLAKIPRQVLFRFNQDFAVRLLGGFSFMALTK